MKSSQTLQLFLTGGAAGTFHITGAPTGQGLEARVTYFQLAASCATSRFNVGASGTVTTALTSTGGLAGTFQVTMQNGDAVSGSFTAPTCDLSAWRVDAGTAGACI